MRKIYLAARWPRMNEMAGYALQIEGLGHEITAQWVFNAEAGKTREENALMDFRDVSRSDLVVSFTHPRGSMQTGGGRHTEFGLAAAWDIENWIVGEREQIFHHLPDVLQFDTFEQVLDKLRG